jgi:LytS/YehU family sensor histidine kinase
LYQFNDVLNATTNAYQYFKKFTSLKDSIAFEQFSQRLAIYKAVTQSEKNETQIKLLSHENTINRQNLALREQEIEASSTARNFLIAGIAIMMIAGLILFRNINLKRKNESGKRELAEKQLNLEKIEGEKRASQLLQQAAELEMQALRSQMNPHFIFNSLNSINRFILQNNKSEASEYLTRFSSLMRVILQGSQSDLISVENELNNLKLYLDLESLRFNFHLEYRINVSTDIEGLKVPPLVIQPYVENSIWHGLMPKEEKGHLVIEVSRDENFLRIRITDDGIGRIKSAELRRQPSSYKSLGMEITSKRMALLNHNSKDQIEYVEIKDLVLADGSSAGTEVNLNIPATYD